LVLQVVRREKSRCSVRSPLALAFNASETLLATAASDSKLLVWDVSTLRLTIGLVCNN